MKVPLLDLKAQYREIGNEIEAVVRAVFASQRFILGPEVEACERAIAEYCGAADAVGVSSGTDALLVSLMNEGIGRGDEVITTPYTFFATAGSIVRAGARPIFVDIDPVSFNMDVTRIEERITEATRAIIPVHLFGCLADMEHLMEIAERHGLIVIEDAAQALGAGRGELRAGAIGDYGCFSFFPSKNLGGAGDGGMVTVRDAGRAQGLRSLRNHGMEESYLHPRVGGNFRLDELQAAVIRVKLRHLDQWTRARQRNAQRYEGLFAESGLQERGLVVTPRADEVGHVFNQYVVRVERRDELRAFLAEKGIGTAVYYPLPLHMQECFAYLGYRRGDFPQSEKAASETLALPVYPELSDDQAAAVVAAIGEFYLSETRRR